MYSGKIDVPPGEGGIRKNITYLIWRDFLGNLTRNTVLFNKRVMMVIMLLPIRMKLATRVLDDGHYTRV
jgi:hypothetical protein